jgi:hypothetical protein
VGQESARKCLNDRNRVNVYLIVLCLFCIYVGMCLIILSTYKSIHQSQILRATPHNTSDSDSDEHTILIDIFVKNKLKYFINLEQNVNTPNDQSKLK